MMERLAAEKALRAEAKAKREAQPAAEAATRQGCTHSLRLSDWLHGPSYWLSWIECVFDCKLTW